MRKIFRNMMLVSFVFWAFQSMGQADAYQYKTPILNAKTGWNSLTLPLDIFSNANENLSDVRIYRTDSKSNRSIEQPYILDILEAKNEKSQVAFKIINPTITNGFYTFTFQLTNREAVDNIHLDFTNKNFDWNIHLEGSMDQNSWSTIVNNYRIVSLYKRDTDFKYTDIALPESNFKYYRISFKSSIEATLKSASISKEEKSNAQYSSYVLKGSKKEDDEESKTTTIELDLGKKLPVSQITLHCNTENDYYRPFRVEGVVDSFNTDKGWKYRYKLLDRGTVNSVNKNVFDFSNSLVQKLKISIDNFDNQPLAFTGYEVQGPKYRLITRLDDTENILLCYGNKEAKSPIYDISFFKDKIPKDLNASTLGEVTYFPNGNSESSPLFRNKWWLWAILIIVILLLGAFTLKMLKEE